MTDPRSTRRELLRGRGAAAGALVAQVSAASAASAAAAASAASAAAAAAADARASAAAGVAGVAPVAPVSDAALLVSLLRVEQVVVFAYERALASGLLSASAQVALTSFLGHERAHVHALSARVIALGSAVPAAPTLLAAFESELRHLHVKRSPVGLRDERHELRFLIDLEGVIAHHYRSAISRLTGDKLLTTAAEIMANEAQHATALSELLDPGRIKRAVPVGFVAGVGG